MTDASVNTLTSSEVQVPLAERMKAYEQQTETQLLPNSPAILRLDGHAFSKFTVGFDRPFDPRLHDCFIETCKDLLRHFPTATTAYTQSDEMTLIFPSGCGVSNDRVQKISSLAAGYASACFNRHLQEILKERPHPPVPDGKIGNAYFDARLFNVPSHEECVNNILWRCRNDCVRNSVSAKARTLFSAKELHGKVTREMLQMMQDKGVKYLESVPSWVPEGSMLKRETYEFMSLHGVTNEPVATTRTRITVRDRGITQFSEEAAVLVVSKYWNDVV